MAQVKRQVDPFDEENCFPVGMKPSKKTNEAGAAAGKRRGLKELSNGAQAAVSLKDPGLVIEKSSRKKLMRSQSTNTEQVSHPNAICESCPIANPEGSRRGSSAEKQNVFPKH